MFIFFPGAVVFPYIEHEFYSISCAVITIRTETRNGQKKSELIKVPPNIPRILILKRKKSNSKAKSAKKKIHKDG